MIFLLHFAIVAHATPAVVVQTLIVRNVPKSGSVSVTIVGTSFASIASAYKGRGHTAFQSSGGWMSDTHVTIRSARGMSVAAAIVLSKDNATPLGTLTRCYTFDKITVRADFGFGSPSTGSSGPSSYFEALTPIFFTGATMITILGRGVSSQISSISGRIGSTAGERNFWTSVSAISTKATLSGPQSRILQVSMAPAHRGCRTRLLARLFAMGVGTGGQLGLGKFSARTFFEKVAGDFVSRSTPTLLSVGVFSSIELISAVAKFEHAVVVGIA